MKDPAFLFYSKDWLSGTAELTNSEKGVYIDFLCYQHQNGSLPTDIKRLALIAKCTPDEFAEIWLTLSTKFEPNGDRLVNRKMTEIIGERKDKGEKNRISGTFAAVLRTSNLKIKEILHLKKCFNVEAFRGIESDCLTERLTEWLYECLKSIGNGDANEDINNTENINFNSLKEYWNTNCGNIQKIEDMTQQRKKTLQTLLKKYGKEKILLVFKQAFESDLLQGKKTDWKADFDWVIKPKNFVKIMEKTYDNSNKRSELDEIYSNNGVRYKNPDGSLQTVRQFYAQRSPKNLALMIERERNGE